MKTFSQKPADVSRRWILIDASTAPLGRVATEIAKYLIGKYKPTYTPHVDGGDYVVVINAAKVPATGDKELQKKYYEDFVIHHPNWILVKIYADVDTPYGLTPKSP